MEQDALARLRERPQRNTGGDLEERRAAAVGRGWVLPAEFVDANAGGTVPHWYEAGLGISIRVSGGDLRELVQNIENWEDAQRARKVEARSRELPPSHPLHPSQAQVEAAPAGPVDDDGLVAA